MDSKEVNKHIRSKIRPLLKSSGFTLSTSRSYWRHHSDRIDVINFQSFNAYNSDIIGCTTFSYSVNLGCYFLDIPERYPTTKIKTKNDLLCPEEYICHFRGGLKKNIKQRELKRSDIWSIAQDGSNLEQVIADSSMSISNEGLTWFDRFSNKQEAFRLLLEEDECIGELWGFGRNPSPLRHYFTGYLASALGESMIAKEHLSKAIDSECFKAVEVQLRQKLSEL